MFLHQKKSAFTLVELSIVLVITALLVGTVLAGRTMIKNEEIKKAQSLGSQYLIAFRQFKLKYGSIPGDFDGATALWGRADGGLPVDANCSSPDQNISSGIATCNGDGDGFLGVDARAPVAGAGTSSEPFRAWQHLSNAGFIAGQYQGVANPNNGRTAVAEPAATLYVIQHQERLVGSRQLPEGPLTQSAYSWLAGNNVVMNAISADAYFFDGDYTNALVFGKIPTAASKKNIPQVLLTPGDQMSLDAKYDDGLPATGSLRGYESTATLAPNCTTGAGTAAVYNATLTTEECTLIIMNNQGLN